MRRLAILVVVALVPGCVTPPQTADELREGVKRGAAMTKTEQVEVRRPVRTAFSDIKANADRCLNVTVSGSTPGRYGPVTESVRYRSSSRMTTATAGQMVLQQDKRATGKMPEGGYFVMLTDIEGVGADRTRVTTYGASIGYGNVFESITAWARGERRECPRFPMGGTGASFRYHTR